MKKIIYLFLTFIFFIPLCLAEEVVNVQLEKNASYLIILNEKAEKLYYSNKSSIYSEIITDIYNRRTQILLKVFHPKETQLFINTDNGVNILTIKSAEKDNLDDINFDRTFIYAILKIDVPEYEKNKV